MKKIFTSLFLISAAWSAFAQSGCTDLFISEYADGSSQNKAIEIYNPSQAPISLTGYFLRRYSNGNSDYTAGGQLALTGTIAPGDVFVITNSQTSGTTGTCDPALMALANQLDGPYPAPTYFNGNDALVLEFGTTKIDIFGKIGEDPGNSWSDEFPYTDAQGSWWTKNHTLVRKASVTGGVTVNPANFNPTLEYDSLPENTWTGLGSHTCVCATSINERPTHFVSVYPNPSNNGEVSLSAAENIEKVELIDRAGRIVSSQINANKAADSFQFSTLNLEKGLYIVKAYMAKNQIGVSKLSVN